MRMMIVMMTRLLDLDCYDTVKYKTQEAAGLDKVMEVESRRQSASMELDAVLQYNKSMPQYARAEARNILNT